MLASHSINFHITLRANACYFVVYIFHIQTWKACSFFTAFICSLSLLVPDSTILLAVNLSVFQNSELLLRHLEISTRKEICCRNAHVKLLHFSVLEKVLWVKTVFTFYFKTCSGTGIFCFCDVMFFSLKFNVLLPENYLFFREIIIRLKFGKNIFNNCLWVWNLFSYGECKNVLVLVSKTIWSEAQS